MRYRVSHRTIYEYSRKVELGSHLAHLLPRALPSCQSVISSVLDVEPGVTFRRDDRDHFGNSVAWLTIEAPHARFEVTARSEVDVAFPAPPPFDTTPNWERISNASRDGINAWRQAEFIEPSPLLPYHQGATAYAAASFARGTPIMAGLSDLTSRIKRDFEFKAGVTTLRSTVGDVLKLRAGVCQDFTHLMIAGLRGLGIPTRYMSGYIRTHAGPDTDTGKRAGSDVSHAWVGAWLGPEHGWVGLDPTNDLIVRDQHVVLGWGRDFSDVSPLFGVILGGGKHTLKVEVELTALGD